LGFTLPGVSPNNNNKNGGNMKENKSIGKYVDIEKLQLNPKNPRINDLAVEKSLKV